MDYNQYKIPNHVALILDGNGRWANAQGKSRSEGHYAGFHNLEKLHQYIFDKGVKVLSVYAFSVDNFNRSKQEVDYLMELFVEGFQRYQKNDKQKKVRIIFSGRREPLPRKVLKVIDQVSAETKDHTEHIFNICVNYGSKQEMIDGFKRLHQDVLDGKVELDSLDVSDFDHYMYHDLPPVDLMIRTSGELRLSNFLLWQNSYSEFYFSNVHFPAFTTDHFDEAIKEYTNRDRRFGGIHYDQENH